MPTSRSLAGDDGTYARFRLFGFTFVGPHEADSHESPYAIEIMDLPDPFDVAEVVADAESYLTDQGRLWSLAALSGPPDDPALTWLSGYDYRHRPQSRVMWRARQTMQLRYLMAQSRNAQPIVLPDGLRVIRMFPEWGGAGPLWENFTDNYPADPQRIGLGPELAADLADWNDTFGARDIDAEIPDLSGWLAQGYALHARVTAALDGVAEVIPDFEP